MQQEFKLDSLPISYETIFKNIFCLTWDTGDSRKSRENLRIDKNSFELPKTLLNFENKLYTVYTLYRVFRNLWDPLRQLIVRLKIMKKCHINICPICRRLWNRMNSLFWLLLQKMLEITTLHLKTSLHASCHPSGYSLYRSWCFSNLSEALLYSIS